MIEVREVTWTSPRLASREMTAFGHAVGRASCAASPEVAEWQDGNGRMGPIVGSIPAPDLPGEEARRQDGAARVPVSHRPGEGAVVATAAGGGATGASRSGSVSTG
jgi:hypothetical protein